MAKALTQKSLENVKPGSARREIPDGSRGLYFVVQPSGATSWAVRYRHGGKPRKLTLGTFPAVKLADARMRADEALRAVAEGRDPAAEKQALRAPAAADAIILVPDLIDEFVRRHVRKCRTATEMERILRKDIGLPWATKKVDEITRRDAVQLLDKIVDRGTPYAARRVFELLRKMLSWSEEKGIIAASPTAGLKAPAAAVTRDRILTDDEIRSFWAATERFAYPFQPFLKLLLLTGQRRDEVAGMRRSELDLDAGTWTLPASRSKNGKAHEIPLSKTARQILQSVPVLAGTDLVFSTTGKTQISGYSKTKTRLDGFISEIAGAPVEDWRLHDLRRTAASGMARLGIAVHVVEAVLNHRSGTIRGVAAIYNRYTYGPEKRTALEAWARFVDQLVIGKPAGNVVPMLARA